MELPGHFSEVLEGMGGSQRVAVYILFEIQVKAHISFFWKAMFLDKKLYVDIPNLNLPSCSKQSFVSMLEYAEECLHCSHVIVCFKKDRPDMANLIRVFKFMGFHMVPPGSELVPSVSTSIMHMAYLFEESDSSSSEDDEI